jgi:hypothetical protein
MSMTTIFLSYSSQDYFFAEMLAIKLEEKKNFRLWRDLGAIRAGDDWRNAIEDGIKASVAVVVALSEASCASSYVTYEWAYALGLRRPVIPVKLATCRLHPRLDVIQHFDFSYPRALPWEELLKRLGDVEMELDPEPVAKGSEAEVAAREVTDQAVRDVLGYLDRHGFTMASFNRLRERVVPAMTEAELVGMVAKNPTLFRRANLKGGKAGLAKVVP